MIPRLYLELSKEKKEKLKAMRYWQRMKFGYWREEYERELSKIMYLMNNHPKVAPILQKQQEDLMMFGSSIIGEEEFEEAMKVASEDIKSGKWTIADVEEFLERRHREAMNKHNPIFDDLVWKEN